MQASGRALPAEAVTFAAPIEVSAAVAVKPLKAATVPVSVEANEAIPAADANEVPPARKPIAVGHVASHPDVSGARARRNIGHRSARVNPKLGCLSC